MLQEEPCWLCILSENTDDQNTPSKSPNTSCDSTVLDTGIPKRDSTKMDLEVQDSKQNPMLRRLLKLKLQLKLQLSHQTCHLTLMFLKLSYI